MSHTDGDKQPKVHQRRSAFRASLAIEPMSKRVTLAAISLGVYALAFSPLYQEGGVGVSALSMFPVVILAWLFGAWGGLLTGLVTVPVNALLLTMVGEQGWAIVVQEGGGEASALVLVVGCVIGLLRDLGVRLDRLFTDWRRAERALRGSDERYRILFERSREPIYLTGPEGSVVDVNEAFVNALGYGKAELLDMDIERLYEDSADRARYTAMIKKDGFVQDFPVRVVRKDGEVRECLLSAVARFDGTEVREYQGTIHDMSDTSGLRELAERRTRELREAVDELEAFSYSVSHDLRTHLVTMGGFLSVLWSDYREHLDEDGAEYLRRIIDACRRMDTFVHDLLDFSGARGASLSPDQVSLDEAVHAAVDSLAAQIEDRQAEVSVSGPLGDVRADRELLIRAVQNLISNAVKFVPAERRPEVVVRAVDEGARKVLEVSDNGIGIDEGDAARISRAFEQLRPRDFPGTGVGLATVRRFADRMGGDVTVESVPGEGSTFRLSLPAVHDDLIDPEP